MKKIILFFIAVVIVTLTAVIMLNSFNKTTNGNRVYFILKEGASPDKVSQELKEKGIIKSKQYFKLFSRLTGYDKYFKPGNYILDNGITIRDILEKFKTGASDFEIVTIPEGYTLSQIASRLEAKGLANKSSFTSITLDKLNKQKNVENKNNSYFEIEGYLFPDTYYIPKELSEIEIAQIMYNRFENIFTEEYRQRAKELGLSTDEVITIASLIEREAANDDERKRISGVIYNRIEINMLLQIDAAVIYGITKGEGTIGRLFGKDLRNTTKYNTYMYKGLPPGPIASPGQPSIEAALYPEKHDYLYYVLGDDGHVFSRTYEEHKRNVNKYLR